MRPAPKNEVAEILADVRRIAVRTTRLVNGALAGGYRSVFRGKGAEFDQVREYEEGDDPRSVDWNVTARLGRPFVKQHIDERNLSVVFVLDLSASMSEKIGAYTPRAIAARAIATIGLSAARANDRVGMVLCAGSAVKFTPIEKGAPHVLRMMRDALFLPPAPGPAPMSRALDLITGVVKRRAIVFVVSDFLVGGFERSLSVCARRHDVIAVRIHRKDATPFPRGMVRMREPETGVERIVDFGDARVRLAVENAEREWSKKISDSFRRAKVDVIPMPVPAAPVKDVVARPIFAFFRMRAERGTKR